MGRGRRRTLIRSASEDELPAISSFVAGLQTQPEHRIAYLGDTTDEVGALLESWDAPWVDSARVVERDGALVGFAAAELDEPLGRAWIHGPFVDDPEWDSVADELVAAVVRSAPSRVDDFELLGDVANLRLAGLAKRQGFEDSDVNYSFELAADGIRRLPALDVPTLAPAFEDAFVALHDAAFPGTYYPGSTLVERASRGESTVVALVDSGSLVAYAAGQIDEGGVGYIDFVGVAPERRREGHGRTVVVAVLRALDALGPIPAARLTVSSTNVAALALYDSLGFTRAASFVGYRRRPTP